MFIFYAINTPYIQRIRQRIPKKVVNYLGLFLFVIVFSRLKPEGISKMRVLSKYLNLQDMKGVFLNLANYAHSKFKI